MNLPCTPDRIGAIIALFCAAVLSGCLGGQQISNRYAGVNGNPHDGKKLIVSYGCGSCHTIPGVYTARGLVGPPLYFFGRRTMIAGELPNTPENLTSWLLNPRSVEPNTAMPSVGLSTQQAQDVTAYLETLH
jgi:cytochrome c